MRNLDAAISLARNLVATGGAWYWLAEIPAGVSGYFRLASTRRHVTQFGKKWQGVGLRVDAPDAHADGSLAEMRLTVPNVVPLPLSLVELEDELLGRDVSVWLTHTSATSAAGSVRWDHRCVRVRATPRTLVMECGHRGDLASSGRVFERGTFPQLLPAGGFRP